MTVGQDRQGAGAWQTRAGGQGATQPAGHEERTMARLAGIAFLGLLVATLAATASADDAPVIDVRWEVTSVSTRTGETEPTAHALLQVSNRGTVPLAAGARLWFTEVADLEPAGGDVGVRREVGTLFSVGLPDALPALAPGESIDLPVDHPGEIPHAEQGPTNPYLAWPGERGRVLGIHACKRIGPRSTTPGMRAGAFRTAAETYRANLGWQAVPRNDVLPVLPTPRHVELGAALPRPACLGSPAIGRGLASERALAASLASPGCADPLHFEVRVGPIAGEASTEAYRLSITRRAGVRLVGASPAGVRNGLRTLAQWLDAARHGEGPWRELQASDAPRFAWRGLMVDVARNFRQPAELHRLVDVMAAFKMNRLHLHLSDDEGWRIEIPALPELVQVGARRGHGLPADAGLPPAVGSGPRADDPHGTGYFSGTDYVALVRHAAREHIEVIPEIDLPGHSRAALRAMEARAAARPGEAGRWRLADPADRSTYTTAQGYHDDVIDPRLPGSLAFVMTVVDELARLHRLAGAPLRHMHLGGDEVAAGAWDGASGEARARLWRRFFDGVLDGLDRRGIRAIGWEELGMAGGRAAGGIDARYARRKAMLQVWNGSEGSEGLSGRLAGEGYSLVLSPIDAMYFSLLDAPDADHPGDDWSWDRLFQRSYGFDPAAAGPDALPPAALARVAGIEAAVWTEWVRGPGRLDEVVMPRLLAVAERAWSVQPAWAALPAGAERKQQVDAGLDRFTRQVGDYALPYVDRHIPGVAYRLPSPGAIEREGQVLANYAWPGVSLHYTRDGTVPDGASPLLEGTVPAGGTLRIVGVTSTGRTSRETRVEPAPAR